MIRISKTASRLIVALFLVVDVGSKIWAQNFLDSAQIVCNYGIGLGISMKYIWIIAGSIAGLLVLAYMWYATRQYASMLYHIAFGAVFVGAFSNLFERIAWGCVIDFIPFFGLWTMNVADALISVGVAIIVITILRK